MKRTLQLLLLLTLTSGCLSNVNAQRRRHKKVVVVKKKPNRKKGVVVLRKSPKRRIGLLSMRDLPNHSVIVTHNGRKTFYDQRNFYVHRNNHYVTVRPAIGILIHQLPIGYTVVKEGTQTYYVHNNVYYKNAGNRYEVVRVV